MTSGVVGSGLMGAGFATQAALHGYPAIVHDLDAARLASVHGKADVILDELIDAAVLDSARKKEVLARIETTYLLKRVPVHHARVKEGRKRLIHHTAKKTGKHS